MPRTADPLAQKQKIVSAAIGLYIDDRANFTIANIARKTRIKKVEIYNFFNSRSAILKYYYPLCVERYRIMTADIDDFAIWSLEEKLANFAYALFDMLQEEREFVEEHFDEAIVHGSATSRFEHDVGALLNEFIGEDCTTGWLASFLAREYVHLISFWLADESSDAQRTMALVDKGASFVGEAVHSSALVYKGIDLTKYLVANDIVKIPLAKMILGQAMRWAR
jgi:AcrR family transcriptional regulator